MHVGKLLLTLNDNKHHKRLTSGMSNGGIMEERLLHMEEQSGIYRMKEILIQIVKMTTQFRSKLTILNELLSN